MKKIIITVATGLVSGLAILCPTVSSAAQACLEMPGKLHLISAHGAGRGEEYMSNELMQEIRVRLNEKAMATCSEREFCIENASIKTTFFFHPWTKIGSGTMTAVVNCLE